MAPVYERFYSPIGAAATVGCRAAGPRTGIAYDPSIEDVSDWPAVELNLPGARLSVERVMSATVVTLAFRLRSRGLRLTQRPFSVLLIFLKALQFIIINRAAVFRPFLALPELT